VIFAGAVSAPARAELITYSLSFGDPDSAEPLPYSSGTITLNVPAILSGSSSIFVGSTAGPNTYAASDFVSMSVTFEGYSFLISSIGNSAGQLNSISFINGNISDLVMVGAPMDGSGATSTNDNATLYINGPNNSGYDVLFTIYDQDGVPTGGVGRPFRQ
jgi:hypothetical protein